MIARNEEKRIGPCLAAIVATIRRARGEGLIDKAEILVSDSASTDRTIDIAREFPVTIVQLPAWWPLSASAGRVVGTRHAHGELLLYVDGDYVLCEEWLPEAIRELGENPGVAAVSGQDLEEVTGDSILMRAVKQVIEQFKPEPEAIPIGLYRRSALDRVGGFHPFLHGGEDRELAMRLRNAGYGLTRLPMVMGIHRWSDFGPLDFITYFHSVLVWSIGDGQAVRLALGATGPRSEALRRYTSIRHLQSHFLGLVICALGLGNLVLLGESFLWQTIVLDSLLLTGLYWVRRLNGWTWRELAFQFHVVPYSLIRQSGFLLGFLRRPRDPSEFPFGETVRKPTESLDLSDLGSSTNGAL